MKIRCGFISNSSSSSFCIIGSYVSTSYYKEIEDALSNQTDEYKLELIDSIEDDTFIGCQAHSILETNTLPQARKIVLDKLHELLPDVPIQDVDLIYGECNEL